MKKGETYGGEEAKIGHDQASAKLPRDPVYAHQDLHLFIKLNYRHRVQHRRPDTEGAAGRQHAPGEGVLKAWRRRSLSVEGAESIFTADLEDSRARFVS